jgi:hypothetical protein
VVKESLQSLAYYPSPEVLSIVDFSAELVLKITIRRMEIAGQKRYDRGS